MVIPVKKATTVPGLLFGPEPPEEPLIGCLISQVVGVENCAADTPEIFHGEYLPSGVDPSGTYDTGIFIIYKVIFTKYSKMVF
jgi:hypothetical protein